MSTVDVGSPWVSKFRSLLNVLTREDVLNNPNHLRVLLEELLEVSSGLREALLRVDTPSTDVMGAIRATQIVEGHVGAILSDYGEFILSGGGSLWGDLLRSLNELNSLLDRIFPEGTLSHIENFVNTYRHAGFTDNWAVAVVHLTAIEIAMNWRRESLRRKGASVNDFKVINIGGQNVSVPKKFYERLDETLRLMETYDGVEIKGILRTLPQSFWILRNQVVHMGYSPTDDEIRLIVEWSRKLVDLFRP